MENLVNLPSPAFWRGKRVLLTGHTGFKGSWLAYWLHRLGAHVTGVGLPPITSPALHDLLALDDLIDSQRVDMLDFTRFQRVFESAAPDVVFHLAAQALVRESYREPVSTFAANVMGTVHTLELIRTTPSVRCAVMITTDKVYANNEWPYPYRENDRLGGHDPYSASKAACELAIDSYRNAFFASGEACTVASARAGNIIGGGDWSADRLIPDAIRAWQSDAVLDIRRPAATRPWQHVLDPLNAYLRLAERLSDDAQLAGAWNFGPDAASCLPVREVIQKAQAAYGGGRIDFATTVEGPHEAQALSLDTSKSRQTLHVQPRWNLDTAVQRTMDWYKKFSQGTSARALCDADLDTYAKQPSH